MAEGRFLSRSIAIDEQLAQLSLTAEFLYLKTIPHLDRDGMITGEAIALLGIISPFRFSELQSQMATCVDEWCAVGLVLRFTTPVGVALFFKGFLTQQRLKYDRERPSKYPAPPGYVRTETGLKRALDMPWVENSGVLPKNPELELVLQESGPQQQHQQQQQHQHQQQHQQQADPPPAPAAAASEVREALENYGITGRVLDELLACPLDAVVGWIEYAGTQARLQNPRGYVIKRLRSGEPPPDVGPPESDCDSYEALRRKYVPTGWEGIIKH